MKIACISSSKRGETDRLLSQLAASLEAGGKTLAGIVKELEYASSFENGCDMKVRVLPDGPVIKITQDLGDGSDACRLDPGAIAEAVSRVASGSLDNVDLFVLNKFGPEEAAGRGFVSVIGEAVDRGVPVLVGVGGASLEAFHSFAGGMAETLSDDQDVLRAWCDAAISARRDAAAE